MISQSNLKGKHHQSGLLRCEWVEIARTLSRFEVIPSENDSAQPSDSGRHLGHSPQYAMSRIRCLQQKPSCGGRIYGLKHGRVFLKENDALNPLSTNVEVGGVI